MKQGIGVGLLALTVALSPGGCGSSASGSPVARFNMSGDAPPNLMEVPFPSDAYLANGKIVDPLPGTDALFLYGADRLTHEIGKMNGFARATFSVFYVDDPSKLDENGDPMAAAIDPASLPMNEDACVADSSSVFLIDLAPADPSKARVRCRGRIHDDSAASGLRPVVAVGPGLGVVLEEGHRYAAVLTSRLRDTSGAHVSASATFQALLSGNRTGANATMYGSAIDQVNASLKDALASDHAQIVAIAPFTTHTASREMFSLRETLDGLPIPTLAWDAGSMAPMGATKFAAPVSGTLPNGFTASLDDWLGVAPQIDGHDDPDYLNTKVVPHDQIAAVGTAVYQGANFLVDTGSYDNLDDRTFARDAQGTIVPNPAKPTVPIWVSLAVPKTAMPAGGYPCVIVGHGSPGSRAEAFMLLANTFAAKGWMVAGIDLITEGARSLESKFDVDVETDWQSLHGTYKGPDGLADAVPSTSIFGTRDPGFNYAGAGTNFGAYRDQQRQAAIDVSELVRLLASNPDLSALQTSPAGAPKIDPTRLAYYGGSMGAIVGSITAAIEPNVKLWVLNVGGGQLYLHSSHAPVVQYDVRALWGLDFGIKNAFVEESSPVAVVMQLAIDAADPLIFAPYLVRSPGTLHGTPLSPRNVLQIEALYDESVANDASEALARAAGWGLAMPNVGPNSNIDTMDEVRDPSKVADRIPLPDVSPDGASNIHDTPIAGVTSVLVQVTGQHYRNMLQSSDTRLYSVPFNAQTLPLAQPYAVKQSFVAQQAMMVGFFDDGFQGKVPNVAGIPPVARDVDEDGTPDAVDPNPNDQNVK